MGTHIIGRATALMLAAVLAVPAMLSGGPSVTAPVLKFPRRDYLGLPSVRPGYVLVGSNYTHFQFRKCSWNDGAILADYADPGVASAVHRQLRAMRLAGVQTLRMIIWYMTNPGPNRWGPVPSAGGHLPQPYRGNLLDFLSEVRRFGFRRLTISFGPQWTNDPIEANYRPAKFQEDWHFIADVRQLVKRYGPTETRFDLLNEGAPSNYLSRRQVTRMSTYDKRMYSAYVHRFGARDVTISVIAPVSAFDAGNRLQNLINLIRGTGLPEPRWFEIHAMLGYSNMLHALRDTEAVVQRNGLDVPLVVGEAPYDDPGAAAAIAEFEQQTGAIEEVLSWYHRPGSRCNASPPYHVSAYRGIPR